MEKARILVIEDNADTRLFLKNILEREFEVALSETATEGISFLKTFKPDLIILDVVLPGMGGLEACALLKKDPTFNKIPIIMLSIKNTVSDIVKGLEVGADDYLTKPFDHKELIARIRSRLRTIQIWSRHPKTVAGGSLRLILDSRDTYINGKLIALTDTEFDILRILLQSSGEVVSRAQIIEEVWRAQENTENQRKIDVHIRAIRKKIPEIQNNILSIYGSGYKYRP